MWTSLDLILSCFKGNKLCFLTTQANFYVKKLQMVEFFFFFFFINIEPKNKCGSVFEGLKDGAIKHKNPTLNQPNIFFPHLYKMHFLPYVVFFSHKNALTLSKTWIFTSYRLGSTRVENHMSSKSQFSVMQVCAFFLWKFLWYSRFTWQMNLNMVTQCFSLILYWTKSLSSTLCYTFG